MYHVIAWKVICYSVGSTLYVSSYEAEFTTGSDDHQDVNKMHKVRIFTVGSIKNMDYCHVVDCELDELTVPLATK